MISHKLTCVAVDDESAFLKTIKNIINLKENSPIELVGEARSVKEAVALLSSTNPDIVFLDIRLTDGTGFDMLQALPDHSFKVIFITAYDQYAIKAFRYSAIDYLMKPIHSEAFWEAVARASEKVSKDNLKLQMQLLMENMKQPDKPIKRDKIVLKEGENVHLVKIQDVTYCEANGSYTRFNLLNERPILVCHHLKDYEEILAENGFIRTHRSYLINKNLIKRYDKSEGGSIYMQDGSRVPVSFRKRESILAEMAKI